MYISTVFLYLPLSASCGMNNYRSFLTLQYICPKFKFSSLRRKKDTRMFHYGFMKGGWLTFYKDNLLTMENSSPYFPPNFFLKIIKMIVPSLIRTSLIAEFYAIFQAN